MKLWRLTRPQYAPGLDGAGAQKHGGRWNSQGKAVVYCGGSLALSCLEFFVHLPPSMRTTDKLPAMTAVALDLPDDVPVSTVTWDDLPRDSDAAAFRALGDRWHDEGKTLALVVPSLIIPVETNVILNPAHTDMKRTTVVSEAPFMFDPRLGADRRR